MKYLLLLFSLLVGFNGFAQSTSGDAQPPKESLVINWPESEHWYEAPVFGAGKNDSVEWYEITRQPENRSNWTEFGSAIVVRGAVKVPLDVSMSRIYEEDKAGSANATLAVLEKDEKAEFPWIIFTIENAASFPFKDNDTRESRLYFIIQGKTGLYTNYWAVRTSAITEAQKKKWMTIFKSGKIVNM